MLLQTKRMLSGILVIKCPLNLGRFSKCPSGYALGTFTKPPSIYGTFNHYCYIASAKTNRDWLIHGHVALDKCNVSRRATSEQLMPGCVHK